MNRVYRYKVKQYLSEIQDDLVGKMLEYPRTLLVSGMGTGKTTLIDQCIVPIAKERGMWVVFVIPSVPQLLQMRMGGIETVCDGAGCSGNRMLYATTPDSMHKVMDMAQKKGKRVWLIVDEAHAVVTSSDFRPKFLEIEKYAKVADWVLRMTATPEPLMPLLEDDALNFGPMFEVRKECSRVVPLTILLADKIDGDTIYKIASGKYVEGERLFTHYNNIKENNIIARKLSQKITKKTHKVLVQNHQYTLFGDKPQFKTIDNTGTAVSLHAKNKQESVAQSLIAGELPSDVAIMCMTSVVKEGMNIYNDAPSTVIIANDNSLVQIEPVQISGRYRKQENIKEIVLVVKKSEAEKRGYFDMKKKYDEVIAISESAIDWVNLARGTDIEMADNMAKAAHLTFNDTTNSYEVDRIKVMAYVYKKYSEVIKQYPLRMKEILENQTAINFKVTIKEYKEPIDKDIKEEVKVLNKERKERFQAVLSKMVEYDDRSIQDILDHTVNRHAKEMQDVYDTMLEYHDTVDTTFKKALSQMSSFKDISPSTVFRKLVNTGPKEYQKTIDEMQASCVNEIIRKVGIEQAEITAQSLKRISKLSIIPRQIFIRKYIKQQTSDKHERIRLSKKFLEDLASRMIDEGYYKLDKKTRQRLKSYLEKAENAEDRAILREECKTKNLDKAVEQLNQDLMLIYNIVGSDNSTVQYNRISSVRYSNE